MTTSEDKIVPSAWIPWIMALAVVFGWSIFTPDELAIRKEKLQDGIGLIHQSDDLPATNVTPYPLVGLVPEVVGRHVWGAPAVLLSVEAVHELPVIALLREGVQGRAPPARA
ncbi:hypothetical protein [Luteolibacter soli]|uniref:Uncharacterized protein n=1 Tax=Luteolibacter soli TaxID=3135280 RepID=A0ABU9AUB1_9BACT